MAVGIPTPPPQPGHLQSLTPHCCAPLRAKEIGPPQGPKGQSWVSPKHPAVLGQGAPSGEAGVTPTPPLPVPYILERHPLPGASQPKGGPWFALLSHPPSGVQPGRYIAAGPQEGVESSRSWIRLRVLAGEGFQRLWDPCSHIGDLPSAKCFPLSRSKNTKLGIPGAPLPGLPSPIPAPTPGWPSWVGGLRGSVRCSRVTKPKHRDPSWPIHLSPHWPPPCLALGNISPTITPPQASAKAIALGRASASSPSLAVHSPLVPLGLANLSPPPETRLFSQTSPRGLAIPLNHKQRDPTPFPTDPPPIVQRGSRPLGPVYPQDPSTRYPLGTNAWAALREGRKGGLCSWGIQKLLSREP